MDNNANVPAVIEMNPTPPAQVRTLPMIANEIKTFRAVMLSSAIEIGRRYVEAKAMLPHGEFGKWVEECTGFSLSTAKNYMVLFREYGAAQGSLFGATAESEIINGLSPSQALALLAIPAEEREAFAEDVDAKDLSVRELKREVERYQLKEEAAQRALKDERDKSAALQRKLDNAETEATIHWAKVREEERRNAESSMEMQMTVTKDNLKRAQEEVAKLRTALSNAKTEKSLADSKAAKDKDKAVAKLQAKLDAAEKRARDAEERAKQVQLTHERNIAEESAKAAKEASAGLQAELDRTNAALDEANAAAKEASEAESKLRQELAEARAQASDSGKGLAQFELLFQQAVAAANQMRDIMLATRQADAETANKLSGVMYKLAEEIRRCAE